MQDSAQRNVDFLTADERGLSEWRFLIAPTATRGAGVAEEQLRIVRTLWQLFDGLVVPTQLAYRAGTVAADATGAAMRESFETTASSMLAAEDGVSPDAVEQALSSVPTRSDSAPAFVKLELTDSRTKVYLADGDRWIDSESDRYTSWYRNAPTKTAPPPVLSFRLLYMYGSIVEDPPSDDPPPTAYWLSVETPSDIWVTETPVGRPNRARLQSRLHAIGQEFDVVETRASTEQMVPSARLAELLDGRGPPEAELLAEHHVDWVEAFAETTRLDTEGDGHAFVISGDADGLSAEEVRRRVDTYVRVHAPEDSLQADRIRIRLDAGRTFGGSLSIDGIDWD